MKKLSVFILSLLFIFSFSACNIDSSVVKKKDTVNIDETGIVKSETIQSLKDENAIQIFKGHCGDIKYEWTLFGNQIKEVRDVNLTLRITETDNSVKITFATEENFDFKPLLSVYLNTKWKALNAAIFVDGHEIGTAELTGTDKTVINITVGEKLGEYTIKPIEEENAFAQNDSDDNEKTGDSSEGGNSDFVDSNKKDVSDSSEETSGNQSKLTGNTSSGKTNIPNSGASSDRELSSGASKGQDQYLTDPVPEGKPLPVEPEDTEINKKIKYSCYFSIECSTIFNNLSDLDPDKLGVLPTNGIILKKQKVDFYDGESVFDVLQRVCKEKGIHMEASFTPMYNSAYVEGINNLYEFDCGSLSGWMYRVDGWYPNYGCSRYRLCDGETVEWRYTCDLGKDVGCEWME